MRVAKITVQSFFFLLPLPLSIILTCVSNAQRESMCVCVCNYMYIHVRPASPATRAVRYYKITVKYESSLAIHIGWAGLVYGDYPLSVRTISAPDIEITNAARGTN